MTLVSYVTNLKCGKHDITREKINNIFAQIAQSIASHSTECNSIDLLTIISVSVRVSSIQQRTCVDFRLRTERRAQLDLW